MLIALVGLSIALAGCSIPDRGPVVPSTYTERAQPLGIPNSALLRRWRPRADDRGSHPCAGAREGGPASRRAIDFDVAACLHLAVSGGGDNGAFGAGLMNGWTTTGTRPAFKMVTGVSTGALIAPFAFLGSGHDAELREVYTTLTPDRIFRRRSLAAALFNDAMADTAPLAVVIAEDANQQMFDEIGREYDKGRLLLIGTTDLDAQRPVIWNIGALATSGHPKALDLFRKILRASSAIPGAFEPVLLDVEIDGRKNQEMHVDGGAIAQLFLYPPTIELGQVGVGAGASPISSGTPGSIPITPRPSGVRSTSPARHRHHAGGQRPERRAAHLLHLAPRRRRLQSGLHRCGFLRREARRVRPGYMQALFEYGYREARDGRAWHKVPPGPGRRGSGEPPLS